MTLGVLAHHDGGRYLESVTWSTCGIHASFCGDRPWIIVRWSQYITIFKESSTFFNYIDLIWSYMILWYQLISSNHTMFLLICISWLISCLISPRSYSRDPPRSGDTLGHAPWQWWAVWRTATWTSSKDRDVMRCLCIKMISRCIKKRIGVFLQHDWNMSTYMYFNIMLDKY